MFKTSRFILVAIQTVFGLLNMILIVRLFGTGNQADAYFLGTSTVAALTLIELLPVEQFLIFYTESRMLGAGVARQFLGASITLAVFTGVCLSLAASLLTYPLLFLFAEQLGGDRIADAAQVLICLAGVLLTFPLNFVLRGALNAAGHFSIPIVISLLPTLSTFLALLLIFSGLHGCGVGAVALAASIGACIQALSQASLVVRLGLVSRLYLPNSELLPLIKNSIAMRFSHNLHNLLITLVINNVLSSYGTGIISAFYYAKQAVGSISSVVLSVPQNVFMTRVSNLWIAKDILSIDNHVRHFVKVVVPIFLVLCILGYYAIPVLLPGIGSNSKVLRINLVANFFAIIAIWQFIIAIEFPYVVISTCAKDAKVFFFTNLEFVIVFIVLVFTLKSLWSALTIPACGALSQLLSFFWYKRRAQYHKLTIA